MSTTPRRLGKYELQQQVGKGNVGEVWKAHDLSRHQDVAIKILHSDLQSDPHFLTRFTDTGYLVTSLHHSNIVQVYEANVTRTPQANGTTAYIAMEYIEGPTLAQYIHVTSHQGNIPSIAAIIYLFTSIGTAVDYIHQNGIIHGNIKPSNILLNNHQTTHFETGEPMLTDAGIAQIVGNADNLGSPLYTSPEQAAGHATNTTSDVYSLGILLYEICAGVTPFRGEGTAAIMTQHINTLPTPPILINPSIPPALSEVILRAMAKNPATRFPTASLLAKAIADACSPQHSLYVEKSKPLLENSGPLRVAPPILGVSQPLPAISLENSRPLPGPLPPLPGLWREQPTVNSGKLAASTSVQPVVNSGKLVVPPSAQDTQSTLTMPNSLARPSTSPLYQRQFDPTPLLPVPAAPLTSKPLPDLTPSFPYATSTKHPAASVQPAFPTKSSKNRLSLSDTPVYMVVGILILLLFVLASIIGTSLLLNKGGRGNAAPVATNTPPGRVFFQDDAYGHNDQLRITMQNIPTPPTGKHYFAWLQDTNQHFLPLGAMTVQNGATEFPYQGDGNHTNLLSIATGFIITLENTNSTPQTPADTTVYQATFNTAILPYLKNILYSTPGLPNHEAVASTMFETIKGMDDKAISIVDSLQVTGDFALAKRQSTRIVEMIDGSSYAASSGDRPANVPGQLNLAVGLLSSKTQPGYIDTLDTQLDQLKQAASNNSMLLTHIQNIKNALNDLRNWLQKMRTDNVQILKAADLGTPDILKVALQQKEAAADSYTGHIIPPAAEPQSIPGSAGAFQAYTESQYLASLDLQKV